MLDREKVIKGLQCIIDGTVRCDSCGYSIDKHGHHSCQQNCASDAIALLKWQEAKKVLEWRGMYLCPKCKCALSDSKSKNIKYCYRCGTAVKWE